MVRRTLYDYFSSQGPSDAGSTPENSNGNGENKVNANKQPPESPGRGSKRVKHCDAESSEIVGGAVCPADVFSTVLPRCKEDPVPFSVGSDTSVCKEEQCIHSSLLSQSCLSSQSDMLPLSSSIVTSAYDNYTFMDEDGGNGRNKDGKQPARFSFMLDVRDKNGVRRGEPGYDPTTLFIPEESFKTFTPFEKQFWSIKKDNFDTIIFFKKGAFYELYEDDADIVARLFDMRIAERVNMKMAGFPEKSYDIWVSKVLEHGYKVGRVEQAENMIGKMIREKTSGKTDKIISRELKEIITPGTIYNLECMLSALPIYTAVVVQDGVAQESCDDGAHFSVLLYDASVNKIYLKAILDRPDMNNLKSIFIQNDIREVITDINLVTVTQVRPHVPIKKPVVSERKYEFASGGFHDCFCYLYNFMDGLCRADALESAEIGSLEASCSFPLDGPTLANLDVLVNNYDGTAAHTLYETVNHCTSAFGQRLLKRWLINPLSDRAKIMERQACAAIFEAKDHAELMVRLRGIGDIERRMGRLFSANPSTKDLTMFIEGLCRSREFLIYLAGILDESTAGRVMKEVAGAHAGVIDNFLADFSKGFIIQNGEVCPGKENHELAELTRAYNRIESVLKDYLSTLKRTTGIAALGFKNINKDIFQIEAPAEADLPPEFYLVSKTKTQHRYYSAEVKKYVLELQETEERIFQANGNLFRSAIAAIRPFSDALGQAVYFIATVDCYISFAIFKASYGGCVPALQEDGSPIVIRGCRSPVYPSHIKNDFSPESGITLITGPNMGGKSTFLRSICLNIILAQTGMVVMCDAMSIPVFDHIFTRIGASDSLARGESTFMAELSEASRIINHSTSRSFIIMDELGRGTSTRDGEAIARAVLDYIKKIGCTTIFSTHYHRLVSEYDGVDKAYVECVIDSGDIVFLYKVRPGVCLDSHGLYVAKKAGVPESLIVRANEIRNDILRSENCQ